MHELDIVTGIHGFSAVVIIIELITKLIHTKRHSYPHSRKHRK